MPPKNRLAPAEALEEALSNAMSTLLKATNNSVSAAQDEFKEELKRLSARLEDRTRQIDELSAERDALLHDKQTFLVELEASKCDADKWRTRAEKAEWVIDHQSININEMREMINEMRQAMKIAQNEAQEWKTQFQRADEERYNLSAAHAELVSRQLYANGVNAYQQTPLTPRSQDPTSTRGVSLGTYINPGNVNGYVTDGELARRASGRHAGPSNAKRTKSQTSHHRQPTAGSSVSTSVGDDMAVPVTSKVLRRVHVMMESGGVTEVKEEQESSDSLGFGASVDGALEGGSEEIDERRGAVPGMSATPRKAATTKRKRTPNVSKPRASNTNAKAGSRSNSQQSRGRKRWTEDKRVYSGSEDESDGDDAADADFLDESERQPRRKATIAPKHKEPSTLFDDEEEEDELMLGSGQASRKRAQSQTSKKRGSPYPAAASKKPRKR